MPDFLSPLNMAIAGGLAIPALVALYFLKLKREEVDVPSTLLWKRAVQDLQVNAPFQRLRRNLLLFLQLLILIAAIVALGRPMVNVNQERDERLVLLIDHSASMNARERDGATRLDQAKEEASRLVEDLGPNDQAMLIAFSDRVSLVTPFLADKPRLLRQIESIPPTDRPTRLKEALELAEYHSTPQIIETAPGTELPDSAAPQGHMILFSDGRIADAEGLVLRRGSMEIVRLGDSGDNVGVVALEVKRNYERPDLLNVFARVRNFSDRPVKTDLTLLINDRIVSVQEVPELDAGWAPRDGGAASQPTAIAPAGAIGPAAGSVGLVPFPEIEFAEAGVAEVRLSRADRFSADDKAYTLIPPPRRMAVLLVTPGHLYLPKLLRGLALSRFDIVTPEQYEAMPDDELMTDGRLNYDVVIFDDHATAKLPPGAYIFFGQGPRIDGVTVGEQIDNEYIVTWDDAHPILRYMTFDDVDVLSWARLTLPEEAVTLVEGETSPVIAYLSREGRSFLLIAFSSFNADRTALNTTWFLRRSLVVFLYNTLQFLAGSVTAADARAVRPGEAVALTAPRGTDEVKITTPSRKTENVPVRSQQVTYFGKTDHVGLYHAEPAVAGQEYFAVNLFDENESFIAPNRDFTVGTEAIESREGIQRINRPLWPYLLLAALVILFVEWYVYNKRVFI